MGESVIILCLVQVLECEAEKKQITWECKDCSVRESCAKWVSEKNEKDNKNKDKEYRSH